MRILLIDDNAEIRDLVRRLVDDSGCCEVVGEAGDGADAIAAVGAHRPELVVMDWQMPGEDGVVATRRLKTVFPHVEVVAFASVDTEGLRTSFARAGASAFFGKHDLGRLIEHLVERAGEGSAAFLPV